jgi:hypothetical protein
MMGFVCAISAALCIIILITISSLLGYVQSIIPTQGLIKIDELHYYFSTEDTLFQLDGLREITLAINSLETEKKIKLSSMRPGCNFGFNRKQKDMAQTATFNYIRINKFYQNDIQNTFSIQPIKVDNYEQGINTCYVDLYFKN